MLHEELNTEENNEIQNLKDYCTTKSNGNLSIISEYREAYNQMFFYLENDKGAVKCRMMDEDDRLTVVLGTLKNDVDSSIENNYSFPTWETKQAPMFSAEELFIAIANENK
jgi:hypothetical protein